MAGTVDLSNAQSVLYCIIERAGGVDNKIKLAKLQYLVDFIHYAFHDAPASGDGIIYTRQNRGPLSRSLTGDLEVLKDRGLVCEDPGFHYTAVGSGMCRVGADESYTIEYVLGRYGKLSWKELEDLSHRQIPYLAAEEGGVIEFFTAYNLIDDHEDYTAGRGTAAAPK